jgi:hypothetical protein
MMAVRRVREDELGHIAKRGSVAIGEVVTTREITDWMAGSAHRHVLVMLKDGEIMGACGGTLTGGAFRVFASYMEDALWEDDEAAEGFEAFLAEVRGLDAARLEIEVCTRHLRAIDFLLAHGFESREYLRDKDAGRGGLLLARETGDG